MARGLSPTFLHSGVLESSGPEQDQGPLARQSNRLWRFVSHDSPDTSKIRSRGWSVDQPTPFNAIIMHFCGRALPDCLEVSVMGKLWELHLRVQSFPLYIAYHSSLLSDQTIRNYHPKNRLYAN